MGAAAGTGFPHAEDMRMQGKRRDANDGDILRLRI